jgi:hypothetical protein
LAGKPLRTIFGLLTCACLAAMVAADSSKAVFDPFKLTSLGGKTR